jgi:hypothetical protein
MEKVCPTCKQLKLISEFSKNKLRKDGLQRECKVCCKANHDKHYYSKKSPTRFKTPDLPGSKTCTDCKEAKPFTDYNKLKAGKHGLSSRCKKCTAKYHDAWRQKNGREWENNYAKMRKKTDPEYKIKYLLRMRLLDAVKRHTNGGKVNKKHSAVLLLGCSIAEAVNHIEKQFLKGMTWENHGIVWEIDHIKPCASYNLEDLEEQKQCFNFTNLQPLFTTTEIAKKHGYSEHLGNRNKLNRVF